MKFHKGLEEIVKQMSKKAELKGRDGKEERDKARTLESRSVRSNI